MKFILLFLTIFSCSTVWAQGNSRLLFIYNCKDAAPDAVLCHNGQPTDTMHPNSLVKKEGANLKGTWSMRPANAPANTRMIPLNLSAIDGKLVIVHFIPGKESNYPVWPYVLKLTKFNEMFSNENWLKTQLEEAGYHNSEDILTGYTPYTFPQPEDLVYVRKPQPVRPGDTIYYDYFNDITCRDSAIYYCIPGVKDTNGTFPFTEYRIGTNSIYQKGFFTNLDSLTKTGKKMEYYKNGRISCIGQYLNGDMTGEWQYFYDTLGSPKWYTENYLENNRDGLLRSFYPNGKLKRTETHSPWKQFRSPIVKDSIISGKCYDLTGKEIPFTPFRKQPTYLLNIALYLNKIVRYPEKERDAGIQGTAIIKFMVTEKGRIYYPKVVRSVCQSIDMEAWRAIYYMPDWQPSLTDGEPTDANFNQPISFKLEY